MASYGYSGALPGPAAVSVQDENVLRVTKITVPRATTVRALSAWLSGVGGGAARTQSGKLVLYADNGSGTRPLGAPLAYTKEATWDKDIPKSNYTAWLDPAVFPNGVAIAAGTYWVGSWVGAATVSSSTLNVHGDTTGGTSLISVPATYSGAAAPPTFPTSGGSSSAANFGYALAVDNITSALIGAIVGTFKVGTGVKVGQPTLQPGVPKITLKGGAFTARVLGDLQSIPMSKGKMTLAGKPYVYGSTYSISIAATPKITLKGMAFRPVEPDKMRPGRSQMFLKAKHVNLNMSASVQVGRPKLLLKGKAPGKVGKAGLIPTVPQDRPLSPTPARDGLLVPTSPYTGSGLLVPTSVKVV